MSRFNLVIDRLMVAVLSVVALFMATCADAQTVTSGSSSSSGSNASVYSHNGSYSGAQINNYGADKLTYGGRYEVTNTPSVAAPGVVTANSCLGAVSGGASGPGFGLSLGTTVKDESCQIIQQAAAINTLAGAKAALHHMAQIPEVCRTLRATGKIAEASICPGDRRVKTVATRSKPATRPAPRPAALAWRKCEKRDDGVVLIRYRGGLDSAAKDAAKKACLASLGY